MKPNSSVRDARRLEIALALLDDAEQAVGKRQALDAFLAQVFRENHQFGGKDRRFYSAVLFAWFRWKGLFAQTPDLPKEKTIALAFLLDGNPPDPAFSAWTPDRAEEKENSPMPTGVTGKIHALHSRIPGVILQPDMLIPSWVEGRIAPSAEASRDALLEAVQSRPPTWLRLPHNTTADGLHLLHSLFPDAAPHAACPTALSTRMRFNLTDIHRNVNACIEIQDLASQAVGHICGPRTGQIWWDVCAASGGKALQLADLMDRRGVVVATDIRSQSLHNLQQRAERAGIRCIHTAHVDVTASSDNTFDGILVDAPCSGIGTWGRNPDARWRLTEADVQQSAEAQARLLKMAQAHVKSGGTLVYSVCTLTLAETTQMIQTFLNEYPGFSLKPFMHPLNRQITDGTCFILPWQEACNGMFIACMKKK